MIERSPRHSHESFAEFVLLMDGLSLQIINERAKWTNYEGEFNKKRLEWLKKEWDKDNK